MPIHIEEMTTEVTVVDGDLPFSPQQIEQLAKIIEQRLDEKHRQARHLEESTVIRPTAEPPMGHVE
jgi:hypothetical protein